MVEGVEADDYSSSRALLSRIVRHDKKNAKTNDDIPSYYESFLVVDHRNEISAPYSPRSFALKIVEDNVASWATHAAIRAFVLGRAPKKSSAQRSIEQASGDTAPKSLPADPQKIVRALLDFGRTRNHPQDVPKFEPTRDRAADEYVAANPLAFLFAVIADQGIPAERAWHLPLDLCKRLGHLEPSRLVADPAAVLKAVVGPPALHRFPQKYAQWIVSAAKEVLNSYDGDAGRIWRGPLTAREVQARLDRFQGIGQKKAAMAVEILERDLGVPIKDMQGSDVAYDIHVRRVFLRTGLAQRDELEHILSIARALHPERPGEIDSPAWLIGRQWCHAGTPSCGACPINPVCPKIVSQIKISSQ
jgi:uncharacterized HhH-GPD family protein